MVSAMFITIASACGAIWYEPLLLWLSAIFNTWFWCYMVSSALFSLWGIRRVQTELRLAEKKRQLSNNFTDGEGRLGGAGGLDATGLDASSEVEVGGTSIDASASGPATVGDVEAQSGITHMIVLPNYKEDEDMLAQTLESLSEAEGSKSFRVVLGFEAREGPDGEAKANRLKEKFRSKFAWVVVSLHPKDLVQAHNDGTSDAEVPGKASNLKWAVKVGYEECKREPSVRLDDVVVTVADADVIFHPSYFMAVTKDYSSQHFNELRKKGNSEQIYTMWQCPQFPHRNFYLAPIPSRTWGYIASTDEFGGVTSLAFGGHHMVFSGYTIPLMLGMKAEPWDGDIVAEDHHAFLRCFFYSIHAQAEQMIAKRKVTIPNVAVRPIFLPAKSTSVASPDGYWASWIERYHQSRRHMQGVSELCYALLASWDTVRSLLRQAPRMLSPPLLVKLFRVNMKLWCMHVLPLFQLVAFGLLSLVWLINKHHVPHCPQSVSVSTNKEMLLCGLAGAWILVWPVIIPMLFFTLANYLFVTVAFVEAKRDCAEMGAKGTIWHSEDGSVPPTWGSVHLTIFVMVAVDVCAFMTIMAVPYTLIPELLAYNYVFFWGNRIKYITASKAMEKLSDYGTMTDVKK
jgi:hypothetical protein